MGAILDPERDTNYFNEIRDLISPDHSLTAEDLSNAKIGQYAFLGRAEVKVLRATNRTSSSFAPNNANPFASEDRDLLYVIQALTAISMLQPQILAEQQFSSRVNYEEWDIDERRLELEKEVAKILPEVVSKLTGEDDGVISTQQIAGTF